MDKKEMISRGTSYISKLLRSRFGKGPQSVYIYLSEYCIIIHLKNFMSPVEEFLLDQKEERAFLYTRELIMKSLLPELKQFFRDHLNLDVNELYYDWGMHNASGIIGGLFDSNYGEAPDYSGKQQLHEYILDATTLVQKKAAFIDSWWVNPRTLVIFRKGITVLLEKELLDLGYENELRSAKRSLEKKILLEYADLDPILHKDLEDIYIDWNFDTDHSMFVYTFAE
ncbi:Na-translocating system protein MpsC family protein [Paenibacillus wulumuqiensis]|uniref:Na-translocating system protein MpsC family protein n=1 Tax=Paenibacillus wulumuqiensis TaxID=1567107 RepID=UPI0006199AF1|nr:Na-translocating system protein MpsC family protein [Paenibacillus wulumuqiensis]